MDAYDLVVIIDALSRNQMVPRNLVAMFVSYVVTNHHQSKDLRDGAAAMYIDTGAPATASLTAEIVSGGECELSESAAMALAASLLDDTDVRAVVIDDAYEWTVALLEQSVGERETSADRWSRIPDWIGRVASAKALLRTDGCRPGRRPCSRGKRHGHWTHWGERRPNQVVRHT